jgi:hypothetical protein
MALTGLPNRIFDAVFYINKGRKGLDTDGSEHDGRISYEIGLTNALSTFQEAQTAKDPQILILAELAFLQQELNFCDEADRMTRNSLVKAVQSFEDALRCLNTVEDHSGYRIAETTFPTDPNYRIQIYPRDAVHVACASHLTRLQNVQRSPGINMKEKAIHRQRTANLKTIQAQYIEKQKMALGEGT